MREAATEELREYVMTLSPRIQVWRVGRHEVAEFTDVVGEQVTFLLDRAGQ